MQGKILYFASVMGLLASSFGSGANYARMKVHAEEGTTVNGEYNLFLLFSLGPIVLLTILSVVLKGGDTAGTNVFVLIAVFFLTTIRHYLDVEYRLKMNFKRFFLYYVFIAAGYALGLGVFLLTKIWPLVFLSGEIAGIVYVFFSGSVLKPPFFKTTERFGRHVGKAAVISGSFFLSDFVSASDRLLLPIFLTNGDELTSIFYYSALVGKMTSLLSSPLNGVLSGYLANDKNQMDRRKFLKIVALMIGVFVVITALAVAGSHLFVFLFYREHYEVAKPYFLLANAGQVLYFICNTMMVIVLRYRKEHVQVAASAAYTVFFLAVSVPLIIRFGIEGMAWGILGANALKFLLYAVLGLFGNGRKRNE